MSFRFASYVFVIQHLYSSPEFSSPTSSFPQRGGLQSGQTRSLGLYSDSLQVTAVMVVSFCINFVESFKHEIVAP